MSSLPYDMISCVGFRRRQWLAFGELVATYRQNGHDWPYICHQLRVIPADAMKAEKKYWKVLENDAYAISEGADATGGSCDP